MSENGNRAMAEVVRMHAAIEAWVVGRTPEGRFEDEIARFLGPEFRISDPDGRIVHRAALVKGLAAFRGKNANFRIVIEAAEVVAEQDNLVIVTYVERQTGAVLAAQTNARRATGVFHVGQTVSHVFLHETWLKT